MKKIGIFMGDITQDYQSVVIKAIFDEANKMGYTAFCFANFGAYGNKILYAEGERGVVYLPDLAELDGIIVGEDTFDVPGMEKMLNVRLFIFARFVRNFTVLSWTRVKPFEAWYGILRIFMDSGISVL